MAKVTLTAKDDVDVFDMLGRSKHIKKDSKVLGELENIKGLELISLISLGDDFISTYDKSVVKQYFEIVEEDEDAG